MAIIADWVRSGVSTMLNYFTTPAKQIFNQSLEVVTDNAHALAQAGAAAAAIKCLPTNAAVLTVAAQVFACNKQKKQADDELKEFKQTVRKLSEPFYPAIEFQKICQMSFDDKNNFFRQWEQILEYIPIAKVPEQIAHLQCMITGLLPINPIFVYVSEEDCPLQDRFLRYQKMPDTGYCFDFHCFFIYYLDHKKFPWEVSAGKTKFQIDINKQQRFFMPDNTLKMCLIHAASEVDSK